MGARDLLRELDRRLLPPAARGLDRLARSGPARRLRRPRPLTAAALASAAAVVATVLWTAADRPAGQPPPGLTWVGVAGDQTIPGYVASTRSELARLVASGAAGQAFALVTFTAYLSPDELAVTLAGVEVVQVYTRVQLPDEPTETERFTVTEVPAGVAAGMSALADSREREAADFQRLSAKLTGDGREERRLQAACARGARLAQQEAAAYRAGCSCLYAAVVRGAPTALAGVARRPQVLAVDPAPEVRRLDQAVFLPPLPDQNGAAPPAVSPPTPTGPYDVRRERVPEPLRSSRSPAPGPATSTKAGGAPPSSGAASQTPAPGPSPSVGAPSSAAPSSAGPSSAGPPSAGPPAGSPPWSG